MPLIARAIVLGLIFLQLVMQQLPAGPQPFVYFNSSSIIFLQFKSNNCVTFVIVILSNVTSLQLVLLLKSIDCFVFYYLNVF